MKPHRREVLEVMRLASHDLQFWNTLSSEPDRALLDYELAPDEVDYLKSFRSQPEICRAYEQATTRSNARWKARAYAIVGGALVLALLAYFLASLYLPAVVQSLALPLWPNLPLLIRQFLLVFGTYFGLFAFVVLVKEVSTVQSSTRIIILSAAVVLLFIPGSLLIGSLSPEGQTTLTRVLLTLVFVLLPASLYWLYITAKRRTLWEEFSLNVARLDPQRYRSLLRTVYRKKFEAIYGPVDQARVTPISLQNEASFPVLLTTFIIGLGWVLFFSTTGREGLFAGLVAPFTFGFLGAYLFSLQMLFRRYVQSDLRSTAYTHVSQRILATWVWAFVLVVVPWQSLGVDEKTEEQLVPLLAFVVGVFPDVGWQVLGMVLKPFLAVGLPSFREGYQLNQIDGITVWVEARLLEEDIENVQNLITANIFDLMLRTNLQPQRIVDWIDQGVLRVHLSPEKGTPSHVLHTALSDQGLIRATDLLQAFAAHAASGKTTPFLKPELDPAVEKLVCAVDDDPNMYHVKAWRTMNARLGQGLSAAMDSRIAAESAPPEPEPSPSQEGVTLDQEIEQTPPEPVAEAMAVAPAAPPETQPPTATLPMEAPPDEGTAPP